MKNVKVPTSRNYQDFLIESLNNPEEAASYLEIILEEGSDEPLLLQNALDNVVEAYSKNNNISEFAKSQYEQLNHILTNSKCSEIYTFIKLLDALGFQFVIAPKENQNH
ncbi:MAG: transcriptional regulator [Nostocales cyanobacterium]|nr:MAG: transcriptional regulator [Nostocales cyanobacterium]TAF21315.1 MAG: transcriptional regulator [Nostocales cyanobacterium]